MPIVFLPVLPFRFSALVEAIEVEAKATGSAGGQVGHFIPTAIVLVPIDIADGRSNEIVTARGGVSCPGLDGEGVGDRFSNRNRTNTHIGALREVQSDISISAGKCISGFKDKNIVLSSADGQSLNVGEGFAIGRTLDRNSRGVATTNHLHTNGDFTRLTISLDQDVIVITVKFHPINTLG